MIDDIVRFMSSNWFQIPFQAVMYYTYYRLGQKREFIRAKVAFNGLSARIDAVAHMHAIKDAHIAALQQQLEEARSAK